MSLTVRAAIVWIFLSICGAALAAPPESDPPGFASRFAGNVAEKHVAAAFQAIRAESWLGAQNKPQLREAEAIVSSAVNGVGVLSYSAVSDRELFPGLRDIRYLIVTGDERPLLSIRLVFFKAGAQWRLHSCEIDNVS